MMEANICDVNCLDSDVLLPPRKRLLACMKKQNSDVDRNSHSSSTWSFLNELDTRLSNLLRAHLSNKNPSQVEIVEASRSAAEVAVRVAVIARSAAEEKAVAAAKAMAIAKKALELVATVDDQELLSSTEQESKKNKTKKRVNVQMLYSNKSSSSRISKRDLAFDLKSQKHKRLKASSSSENGRNNNRSEDENTKKMSRIEDGNGERTQLKVKLAERDTNSLGRKRGKMKQKKLPLSICHDRDRESPKKDHKSRSLELVKEHTRKFKDDVRKFKAPARVNQNKVTQS